MKKFIRTLYQSFYSREFYNDVAHKWTGTGIGLLAWLSLIGTIFLCVTLFIAMNTMSSSYNDFKAELINQVPQVTVDNGTLSIDRPTPYYIAFNDTDDETGEPVTEKLALIDTSDAATQMNIDQILAKMHEENLKVFVARHQVVTIQKENEFRIYDLKDQKEKLSFGKKEVENWVGMMELIFLPFMAAILFLFVWVYKIIQMLLYSLLAMLLEKFVKSGIEYEAMQRITTCAIFPATIIGAVLTFIGLDLPFFVSFLIISILITFGLKSAKTPV